MNSGQPIDEGQQRPRADADMGCGEFLLVDGLELPGCEQRCRRVGFHGRKGGGLISS